MLEFFQSVGIFFGLNALVLSTANAVIWRFFPDEMRDVFDWVILMFVFVVTEVLLVMGVMGFAGYLDLSWVSSGVVLLYLVGSFGWTWSSWGRLRLLIQDQEVLKGQEWIFAVFGFLLLYGVVELFNAFVQYPWEYDTLAYHMPMVVEWIQAESLWHIFYAVWGGPLGYYPAHHELLVAWFVLPFGHDFLANLLNFGVVAVLLVTMYKILKAIGVDDFLAWLGGALVMVMPIFLRQVGTGKVDILLALSVLIGWYFLLRSFQRRDGLLLIPLLCNFAILLGTKYLSLLYILPLAVVFLFFSKTWYQQSRIWWIWSLVIIGGLGAMWYWRNLLLTGNPFFPADLSFGDQVFFEGYSGLSSRIQELSLWYRVTQVGEWSEWIQAMIHEAGWHLYLVIGAYIALTLEVVVKLVFGGLQRGEGRIYTLMLFFLPAYWYLYFIAPYTASMMEHNVRYAMPWLMLAMIMVMYTVYKLGPLRKFAVMGLLTLLWWQFLTLVLTSRIGDHLFFETTFISRFPELFGGMLLVLGVSVVFFETWRRKRWYAGLVLIVVLVLQGGFLWRVSEARDEIRSISWQQKYSFPLMKAYEWLDLHAEDDDVIANSLNPLYYPLYGKDLTRRVRYININACGQCDYADYHHEGMTIRDEPSYESWQKNLTDAGVDYLVLGYSVVEGLEGVTPYELQWVEEYKKDFEILFQQEGVLILRPL